MELSKLRASIRECKERQDSLITSNAKTLKAIEERLVALEARPSDGIGRPPSASQESVNSIDTKLNAFGNEFNELEERVHLLEQTRMSAVEGRLKAFDERLQPYEEYQKKAKDAVQTLSSLQEQLRSVKENTSQSPLRKEVTGHDSLFVELSERLRVLEQPGNSAYPGQWSTTMLATQLIGRLRAGDVVASETRARLQTLLHLDDSRSIINPSITAAPVRVPISPPTEGPSTRQSTATDGEAEAEQEPPRKRHRRSESSRLQAGSKRDPDIASKSASARARPSVLEAFQAGRLRSETVEAPDGLVPVDHTDNGAREDDQGEAEIPPESPRRSIRRPKPTERGKDFLSWPEAKKRMRVSSR